MRLRDQGKAHCPRAFVAAAAEERRSRRVPQRPLAASRGSARIPSGAPAVSSPLLLLSARRLGRRRPRRLPSVREEQDEAVPERLAGTG